MLDGKYSNMYLDIAILLSFIQWILLIFVIK